MKTFYIPVHFYEQEPECNELVMIVTQRDINDSEFSERLRKVAGRYLDRSNDAAGTVEIADKIFDAFSKEIGGVWSYCKTVAPLVIGDPQQQTEKVMKAVSASELADLIAKLKPGESLDFYETYDEESGTTEGNHGAAMIEIFDSYVILVNYYGGGVPYVTLITPYDTDLENLTDGLDEYFSYMGNQGDDVTFCYIKASRL